ncbi:c-1-tetrahydrofolate synthase cytoplasmic-related [Holotrichia oblita]|nr:c-1-tetrahydrofolate synthase cytoplasmic-related [Holotrichia oblita]
MMKTDIEIAESVKLKPIQEIAARLNIEDGDLELYGKYKAKVNKVKPKKHGKLILVTAINPTASGEGKTTVSIGLADSISASGASVALALREPSLGPVFGVKGGATGGGQAQIAPMADINLHFTGDLHAITSANNLLSSIIDNHINSGNALKFKTVAHRRCLDCNDRALRNIVIGLGGAVNGVPREDGFVITAASEVMAVMCLATSLDDLKTRLGNIIAGYTPDGYVITAKDLKANEAMTILLKDAFKPNLVQTLEGTPAFVHCGPFANIAHGCNSVAATDMALKTADYCVTEAGFGADLGAQKFLDIKARAASLKPACVVIVATIKALKLSGYADKQKLSEPDEAALRKGLENLKKHIENMTQHYKLPTVVAINEFISDTAGEIELVKNYCKECGVEAVPCKIWEKGSAGGLALAATVMKAADNFKEKEVNYTYSLDDSIEEKIRKIAVNIYGADGVDYLPKAKEALKQITNGFEKFPVCIAKTQYSLSDNAALLGRPRNFRITIKDLQVRGGAGFIVAVAGDILLMPGLPKVPNSENMSINSDGDSIKGLF